MGDEPNLPRTVSHTEFRDLRTKVEAWIDEDRKEHKELREDHRRRSESHAQKLAEVSKDITTLKVETTKQNVTLDVIVRQTRRDEAHVDKAIERSEDTKAHLLIDARKTRNKIIVTVVGFIFSASAAGALIHWLAG